jgi:hypothetical protein
MADEQVKINEGVSSIVLTKNSKGTNFEIKIYQSSTQEELDALKVKAMNLFEDLKKKFGE